VKRSIISSIFVLLLVIAYALCDTTSTAAQAGISGQGKMRFRLLYSSTNLPQEAQSVLKSAHGGFAVDTRPGKGEVYFSLKGAGVIQISSDLKTIRMMKTPSEMKDTNLHNTTIMYAPDGKPYLMFPGNEAARVFVTNLDGDLMQAIPPPEPGADLGHPVATDYFRGRGNFVPTDVEYLEGLMYITTGYSNLDFVLSARVASFAPFRAEWHDLAFGGRGTGPGNFGTGHGITVPPGIKRLDVADRPNSEIDRFTRYGQYMSTLRMPLGSFPCDIYYLGNYAVVGSLYGPDRSKGAPIYILENDQLISTVMPKEELGLANFTHVHNAVLREYGNKLYIIAQAWNPGDFAILEQVTN
jgi:hypothetical protein